MEIEEGVNSLQDRHNSSDLNDKSRIQKLFYYSFKIIPSLKTS